VPARAGGGLRHPVQGGAQHALARGDRGGLQVGDIDVGLLETPDARRFTAPIILLIDDQGLQPHENVVPLVRTAVLDRWGDRLRTALDETSARLTDQEVVALNRAVDIDDLTPREAARQWWERQ